LAKQGININNFSPENQEKVATYLLQTEGMGPWAPYNARLASAYNAYRGSGTEPADLAGRPLAYWEKGYKPGATFGGGTGTTKDPAVLPEVNQGGAGGGTGGPAGGYEPAPTPNTISDATIRRSLMLQMLGQALKGMKLTPMQVGYDPFKVQQAGEPRTGPVQIPVQGLPEVRQSPVNTRYLPAPQPIAGPGGVRVGGNRTDLGQAIVQSRMYENLLSGG